MHRIDAAGYAAGNLFTDGNPSTGTPATVVDAAWLNGVQENIAKVIEAAGITLSKGDDNQLKTAIQQLSINGGAIKTPARAATTANIASLTGGAPSTLDGVALAANDRILVKDQTTGSQNGIYVVTTLGTGSNGTWTRATDADAAGEIVAGMLVVVAEGTTNGDTEWELTTNGTITVGSTALTFLRFVSMADFGSSLAASGYQKLPSGLIVQWGQLSITLLAGGYTASVTFPVSFPNACLQVFPCGHFTNGDSSANADNFRAATYARSATGASFEYECINTQNTGSTLEYFAIGY